MKPYTAQSFEISELDGISKAQIDAHIKLYEGYVSHTNTIIAAMTEKDGYELQELKRRFGFEFDGMRLHEYYFGALTGGADAYDPQSALATALEKQFGSHDAFIEQLTQAGMTRGSGWALLYWDQHAQQFLIHWADEHHLGHLATLPIVLALDCWEHAYMIDHDTTGRKAYIESYLANLNWNTLNNWFEQAQK